MITLQTLQGTGVLRIQSYPPGAMLSLNGDEYGKVPITITNVESGEYDYTLSLEGYDDYKGTATVKAGELCCVDTLMSTGDQKLKCVQAPPIPGVTPTIPETPGYITIREKDFYGGLGLLIGLIFGAAIAYLLLRKKE